uniref:histidinol dehydrogenase n=1 Tax=Megasphaera elsdenii TaxID=907 RepID=UPI00402696E8
MEWIDVPSEGLTLRDIRRITKRDQAESEDIRKAVEAILADIEQSGDAAVREYTKRFDGVDLDSFLVSPEEIDTAVDIVGPDFMAILEEAAANIRAYHERQVEQTWIDTFRPGVRLGAKFTPIQRVGVYVPGGTAAYPCLISTTDAADAVEGG